VRFDDRTTYRQAHTNSVRFGCVEGFKESVHFPRLQSDAGVLHADVDSGSAIVFMAPRANRYFSLSFGNIGHRFDAVHDQIEQHLLQLDPIP
jgi:hypothetical protein